MTTYKRDLRTKFEEIIIREAIFCSDGLELTSPYKERIEEFAEKLADAAISTRRASLEHVGLEWKILGGDPIEQEEIDTTVSDKEATDSFERELHFNPLPWDSTKEWEKLRKFVIKETAKDSSVWKKYNDWRDAEGKFKGGIPNTRIYRNPSEFTSASFPAFLAHTAMYSPKTPEREIHHASETKRTPNPYNPEEIKARILAAGKRAFPTGTQPLRPG